jgi:hypothetical protein
MVILVTYRYHAARTSDGCLIWCRTANVWRTGRARWKQFDDELVQRLVTAGVLRYTLHAEDGHALEASITAV